MRWEHVDFEARTLLIPDTKNGTPRTIPLSPGVLDSLPTKAASQPVWGGIRKDSISQAFRHVCKIAGVTGIRLHDMRHEATTRLFEKQGFNNMGAAAVTGHKTFQTLKRYMHLRAEDLAKLRMK